MHLLLQAHLTSVHSAARRTFTLTRTGLLLRMDKYEPHNFHQFDNEQSIVIVHFLRKIKMYEFQCSVYKAEGGDVLIR